MVRRPEKFREASLTHNAKIVPDKQLLNWMKTEHIQRKSPNKRGWENETIRDFLRDGVLLRPERNHHRANHEADDEFWSAYGKDVNDLLMDAQSDRWLNGKMWRVLGQMQSRRGHDGDNLTPKQPLTNRRDQPQPARLSERFDYDEEAARETSFGRLSPGGRLFLEKIQESLFTACKVAAWTLNIAAALTLLMLVPGSVSGAEIWYVSSREAHVDVDIDYRRLSMIWLTSACSLVYYGCFYMELVALE